MSLSKVECEKSLGTESTGDRVGGRRYDDRGSPIPLGNQRRNKKTRRKSPGSDGSEDGDGYSGDRRPCCHKSYQNNQWGNSFTELDADSG